MVPVVYECTRIITTRCNVGMKNEKTNELYRLFFFIFFTPLRRSISSSGYLFMCTFDLCALRLVL